MALGDSKKQLVQILDYYKVNRVNYYSVDFVLNNGLLFNNRLLSLRNVKEARGKFFYGVTWYELNLLFTSDVVENLKPSDYIVCDSLQVEDRDNLTMNGEALIKKDEYNEWTYHGNLNYKKGRACRDIESSSCKVIENKFDMPKILFNEMWTKGIVDLVVEFSIYNKSVGLLNSRLLIWEIRRY